MWWNSVMENAMPRSCGKEKEMVEKGCGRRS